MKKPDCKKPCRECPFSRKVRPGLTGGAHPLVFVGQAHGPFWLPCHMDPGYDEPGGKTNHDLAQCAGAAMYRHMTGRARLMPEGLHSLQGDPKLAFSTPAELVAHHLGISVEVAKGMLKTYTPDFLLEVEFSRLDNGLSFDEAMAEAARRNEGGAGSSASGSRFWKTTPLVGDGDV